VASSTYLQTGIFTTPHFVLDQPSTLRFGCTLYHNRINSTHSDSCCTALQQKQFSVSGYQLHIHSPTHPAEPSWKFSSDLKWDISGYASKDLLECITSSRGSLHTQPGQSYPTVPPDPKVGLPSVTISWLYFTCLLSGVGHIYDATNQPIHRLIVRSLQNNKSICREVTQLICGSLLFADCYVVKRRNPSSSTQLRISVFLGFRREKSHFASVSVLWEIMFSSVDDIQFTLPTQFIFYCTIGSARRLLLPTTLPNERSASQHCQCSHLLFGFR
jgi:hypothetical protein